MKLKFKKSFLVISTVALLTPFVVACSSQTQDARQTPAEIINQLKTQVVALSSLDKPIPTVLKNHSLKPEASTLTTIASFDNLVDGTPFSDIGTTLPQGVTITSTVSEISEDGVVTIVATFTNIPDHEDVSATLYLGGFRGSNAIRAEMQRIVTNLQSVGTLDTTLINREVKPEASKLTSISSLDDLVKGTPFSTKVGILPSDIKMQTTVSDINIQRNVTLKVTLSSKDIESQSTEITLSDFALSQEDTKVEIARIGKIISNLGTLEKPLQAAANENNLISFRFIGERRHEFAFYDEYFQGTPIEDALKNEFGEVPQNLEVYYAIFYFVEDGGVQKLALIIQDKISKLKYAVPIYAGGLSEPEQVFNRWSDALAQNGTIDNPLLVDEAHKDKKLTFDSAEQSPGDLDKFVVGDPFKEAIAPFLSGEHERLPQYVYSKMIATIGDIDAHGVLTIKIDLSLVVNTNSDFPKNVERTLRKTFNIYVAGFNLNLQS